MVVEPFELRKQRRAASGRAAARRSRGSLLDRLAERQGVREAADAGDPFRQDDGAASATSLEALLHAAMLEEELRMKMKDVLADIEEDQFGGFHDVGAHRSERQALHVGALDLRERRCSAARTASRCRPGTRDRSGGQRGCTPSCSTSRVGSGWPRNATPNRSDDFALVPAKQRADRGDAGTGPRGTQRHTKKSSPLARRRDDSAARARRPCVPGIGHLHPRRRR